VNGYARSTRFVLVVCAALVFLSTGLATAQNSYVPPGPRDKCPVCGMFVHKYPDFAASIIFKDGHRVYFDGAKDMFKFYHNMTKYDVRRLPSDIAALYVIDYYALAPTDGLKAIYVIGSDVLGPMGHELIPFAKGAEAAEFKRDHRGRMAVTFNSVSGAMVKGLDQ
jgi:copper chaperone NosL